MKHISKNILKFGLAFGIAILAGCSDSGPTSSSKLTAPSGGAFGPRSLAVEQFTCDNIENYVRFSDPGSVDGTTATLFFSYGGVPDGAHTLNVQWDEVNAPGVREEVLLDALTTPAAEAGAVNIVGTVAHSYTGIVGDVERAVRVELAVDGLTGNCASVRHITLSAPAPDRCRLAFGVARRRGCRPR